MRRWMRHWEVGGMLGLRSGLPYSVLAFGTGPAAAVLRNNRADVRTGTPAQTAEPVPGGIRLLQRTDFANPSGAGNLGRNSLRGPGVVNLDLSLARTFRVSRREGPRLTLRADAYNLLNHANLGMPANQLDANLGVALFGRQGVASRFPAQQPFDEPARNIQLLLRLEF